MQEIIVNDHKEIDVELTEEELSEILKDLPRFIRELSSDKEDEDKVRK